MFVNVCMYTLKQLGLCVPLLSKLSLWPTPLLIFLTTETVCKEALGGSLWGKGGHVILNPSHGHLASHIVLSGGPLSKKEGFWVGPLRVAEATMALFHPWDVYLRCCETLSVIHQ